MKRRNYLILLVLLIGIGFALITSNFSIEGLTNFRSSTWKIYFDNVNIINGDSFFNTYPTTENDNTTELSFNFHLPSPGDEVSFYVDIVNDGSVDAMINLVSNTSLDVSNYCEYSLTYMDGASITQYDKLSGNSYERVKFSASYKEDVDMATLTSEKDDVSFTINLTYQNVDNNVHEVNHIKNVNYLIDRAVILDDDYNVSSTDEIKEMVKFSHPATDQLEAVDDYRYIGSNPNNYVRLNNYLWRIIGAFKNDGEYKLKLIQAESDMSGNWTISDSEGTNDFTNSLVASYLNGDDFLYKRYTPVLDYIDYSTFYLGAGPREGSMYSAPDTYMFERGNQTDPGNNLTYRNYMALMYLSDFLYTYSHGVSSDCYNNFNNCSTSNFSNSWIYEKNDWFIDPALFQYSYKVYVLFSNKIQVTGANSGMSYRPVLYLKSDVKFISGDGSRNTPYLIG